MPVDGWGVAQRTKLVRSRIVTPAACGEEASGKAVHALSTVTYVQTGDEDAHRHR